MINKDIFDALVTLLGDGKVEIPDIEQIRAITKVNKASKEERERNREINVITAKIRGRASSGYFDLGELVCLNYFENIEALIEGGYIVEESELFPGKYFISWCAKVVGEEPIEPEPEEPTEPSEGEDISDEEEEKGEDNDDENPEDGTNEKGDV